MPNWNEIRNEIQEFGNQYDYVRKKYLTRLSELTERNVIAYYSGFMQKTHLQESIAITDFDMNGFMATTHRLDKSLGLDLILHTPGGSPGAIEALVVYLKEIFNDDIRAIVPQLALSGGTIIACACKSIVMGHHSNLGPIDPLFRGLPASAIVAEFEQAQLEIRNEPNMAFVWDAIISQYFPTLVDQAKKGRDWAHQIVRTWLTEGMFKGLDESELKGKLDHIIQELGDPERTLSPDRQFSATKCKDMGLKIELLEDNKELQDEVLSVHHAFMLSLANTPSYKIIQNQNGVLFIQNEEKRPPPYD